MGNFIHKRLEIPAVCNH